MASRVNSVNTLGSAVAHITGRLKEYTQKTVPPNLWKEIINTKVDMIHEVLGTKDKAVYKDTQVLTPAGSQGGLVTSGNSCTYTKTTKVLYIPAGLWAGLFSTGLTDATTLPVGATVVLHLTTSGDIMWVTKIASITDATHIVLEDDYGTSLGSDDFDLVIHFGDETSETFTISSLTCYKYIDQIISIYDSGITDECIDAGTISNFWGIKKRNLAYNYIDSIVWIRDGEYLRFAKGSNISAYGTRTMYYTRKPYPVSVDADYIDLPPSQMDLLYKLCMLDGLQVIQVPIPDELKSAEGQISAMRNAKEEEIAKYLLNKSDN